MWHIYSLLSYVWDVPQNTGLKSVTEILKNAHKGVHFLVKLQAWHSTSRTPLNGGSCNRWLFFIQIKSCSFDTWFVFLFKSMKTFKQNLKLQSSKLYNNKYMITWTQITNTEIFAFIAALVFKILSRKVSVYKQKRQ